MSNNIVFQYLKWYFIDRIRVILSAWKNFLRFYFNYFSIPILFRTLFSPWKRISEPYGKKFDPWHYIEAFVMNVMSRTIGAIIRICFLVVGIFFQIIVFLSGLVFLVFWIIAPGLFFVGVIYGFSIL